MLGWKRSSTAALKLSVVGPKKSGANVARAMESKTDPIKMSSMESLAEMVDNQQALGRHFQSDTLES